MKRGNVLILGAGNNRDQRLIVGDPPPEGPTFGDNFSEVTTIDIDPACKPSIVWDLEVPGWPVPEDYFDEVHAYEVLEHLGRMGDYEAFFHTWKEIWLTLKPGGLVCATTPWWQSVWAWQDPGHRRVYSKELLVYLDQNEYVRQVGKTAMTDYRRVFPPPFSFGMRYAGISTHVDEEGNRIPDPPERAGFHFVLSKEVYERKEVYGG